MVMLPDALRYWRAALLLSQKDAAKQLGLSVRQIELMENGTRPISRQVELSCIGIWYMTGSLRGTMTWMQQPYHMAYPWMTGPGETAAQKRRRRRAIDREREAANNREREAQQQQTTRTVTFDASRQSSTSIMTHILAPGIRALMETGGLTSGMISNEQAGYLSYTETRGSQYREQAQNALREEYQRRIRMISSQATSGTRADECDRLYREYHRRSEELDRTFGR
jgi:transcriptional regulator with XRE-family HTH domain